MKNFTYKKLFQIFLVSILIVCCSAVFAQPVLTSTVNSISVKACSGFESSPYSFAVNGSNLTSDVLITPSAGVSISGDGVTYSNTLKITPLSGVVNNTVYLKLGSSVATGSFTGTLTLTTTGASNVIVSLSGYVDAVPSINVSNLNSESDKNFLLLNYTSSEAGKLHISNSSLAINQSEDIATNPVRFDVLPIKPGSYNFNYYLVSNSAAACNSVMKTFNLTVAQGQAMYGLMDLVSSAHSFQPVYLPSQLDYWLTLPFDNGNFTLTATSIDASATININNSSLGTGQLTSNINVPVGTTDVPVRCTGYDLKNFTDYTVHVTREGYDTTLQSLSLSSGLLNERFDRMTYLYSAMVDYTVSQVLVNAVTNDPAAILTVNNKPASQPVLLNVGKNMVLVSVKAQNGVIKNYQIEVTRAAASTNADLAQLDLRLGASTVGYGPVSANNSLSVLNTTTSVVLTLSTSDSRSTLKVNNEVIASGANSNPIALNVGLNTIPVVVTAEDGTTKKTYNVHITRSADNSVVVTAGKGTVITINATGTTGLAAGATAVDFTGTTKVMIGGVAATSFVVVSRTRIDAVVGNSPSGDIVVTTPTATVIPAKFVFLSTLPVNFVYLKSKVLNDGVSLSWLVADIADGKEFVVERSLDGVHFNAIGNVAAKKNASTYIFKDVNAATGTSYYRIKAVSVSLDAPVYSTVIKIGGGSAIGSLTVYPNPVTANGFSVSVSGMEKGDYTLQVINVAGLRVLTKPVSLNSGINSISVKLSKGLSNGIYSLSLKGVNGVVVTQQVVVNNK